MAKQIAVISAHNDAHIPFVEKHLKAPILRIDPQEITRGAELSFYFDARRSGVTYKGENITDLKGVWLRKPQPVQTAELPVADNYKAYSQSAIERLTAQLLTAFPEARWLSDSFAQNRANNKALQLTLARECGFNVVPTLFTSSPEAAKQFIAVHGQCITKPLAMQFPQVSGQQTAFMSTQIGSDFMPNLTGLHLAPAIFQKLLAVDIEVRAVVVDQCVFAATVHTGKEQAKPQTTHNAHVRHHIRDGRYSQDGATSISPLGLPVDIAARCIKHCKLLGMPFGAIDLIRDIDGVWWFLENNPNGQWAFVEDATGQPIGKAIADYLEGHQ